MKDLNPQQKAAAAKRKLGPSSLLAFWKRPITGYITSTSLPGKGIPYWSSSSMPLFIPPTRPFAQCAAHGCVPLTINTQINTLVFSCKICWRVQRPKITQEKNDTPQPRSDLTVPDLIVSDLLSQLPNCADDAQHSRWGDKMEPFSECNWEL